MAGAFALFGSTALPRFAWAKEGDGEPFSFDGLTAEVRTLATEPYAPSRAALPIQLASLDYDGYRLIRFPADHAAWSESTDFRVQPYHMGWLYQEPVALFDVADGLARPLDFSAADFEYLDAAVGEAASKSFPGVAGFHVNHTLNSDGVFDELISFLGASYFRALGRGNVYGASARGLVINSYRDGPEEFPRFSRFYLERPTEGRIAINAVLDSPSVAGAYRFEIVPASAAQQETVVEVTARLFFRTDVAEVGIAPLTSMFLFSEVNRSLFDDYRPQVHDSNGLMVEEESGDRLWRTLSNGRALGNSYFWENNPKAFGLDQRGRDFAGYEDAGANYERRPSVRVEPIGTWGQGTIRLIEIPARLEADDNIVAFWVPADTVKAGDEREYRYRLLWGDLVASGALAQVVETRSGQGGFSGVENAPTLRKFVVDFGGGELDAIPPDTSLDILASASAGVVKSSTVSRVPETGLWRLVMDVDTADVPGPIELKAYLVGRGKKLTETWLYQWRGA